MDAGTYDSHWTVFLVGAGPAMAAVKQQLRADGVQVSEVSETDHGDEKSLTIEVTQGDQAIFLDLYLLDGDENGFGPDPETDESQVAVKLTVVDDKGIEHFSNTPYQYTDRLGVHTPADLMQRISCCMDAQAVAAVVRAAAARHFTQPSESVTQPGDRLSTNSGAPSPSY